MEGERFGKGGRAGGEAPPAPLSPATFYRRHKRQAAVLIGAMALMIMGMDLFVFIAGMFDSARQPMLNHLKHMSVVLPGDAAITSEDREAIGSYPAVERVVTAYKFSPLGIAIPPVAPNYPGEAFAVSADDLGYVVEALGLELLEGRLPRAGSNEIVIPYAFARNRNLHAGDAVGDPDHPVFRDAPALPGVLSVSGIFVQADPYAEEIWLSFFSLEFVERHRAEWKGELALIVLPKPGRNAELERWLEAEWQGGGRLVLTHSNQTADFREQAATLMFVLGLMESILALVAAATLAGLHFVFTAQRKAEFGVLHALGLGRRRLIWRGVQEAFFTSCGAWLAAVVLFAAAVLCFQVFVYDPAGLQLEFFNPTPWFFTLPVPLAVLAAGAATMAWDLSRMDPVAIIERRD
jgi:hypothetical protein